MRLPRRVPWASLTELEHLCAYIYSDENDIDAKIYAINRISAWKSVTTLPHALESVLALLVVFVQDRTQSYITSLSIRQSYATAIIRLVNGLVDPLQVGTYARSIISIAQQLGLPAWLVELRHAATHDDLPSLELLREAGRQSMAWLLQNYFLPTINPISYHQQAGVTVRPIASVLKVYKNTMKIVTRDVSLVSEYKPRIVAILRDIERWISECKVAACMASGDGNWVATQEIGGTGIESDAKETWALERLCESLIDKGALVPLSKKKRLHSSNPLLPSKSSTALWEPLLRHVQGYHSDLPYVLCRKIVSVLVDANTSEDTVGQSDDSSYYIYLACWVSWIIKTCTNNSLTYISLKKDILSILMTGLGHKPSPSPSQSAPFALFQCLTSGEEKYEAVTALFLMPPSQISKTEWNPYDLAVMEARHAHLESCQSQHRSSLSSSSTLHSQEAPQMTIAVPGWRIMQEHKDWKASPIGVFAK